MCLNYRLVKWNLTFTFTWCCLLCDISYSKGFDSKASPGDMNCRAERSDNPEVKKALLHFCRSYNLSQLTTKPTQVTDTTSSILDAILALATKQFLNVMVLESSISDHDLVYITLKLKKERFKPVYITSRSYKHYKTEAFYDYIFMAPWSIVDVFDNVEDKLHELNLLLFTHT